MKTSIQLKSLSDTNHKVAQVRIFFDDASSHEIVLVKGTSAFFCSTRAQLFIFLALTDAEQEQIEQAIDGTVERNIHYQ